MAYKIRNENGTTGGAWSREYETLGAAENAIRYAMGWDGIVIAAHPQGGVWSAYETQEDADADETGAHAPSIHLV